jgi:hypothetical protein
LIVHQSAVDKPMVQNNSSYVALSQRRTTVSILRGILGQAGQEQRFAKLAGRSTSWVKKVSAGITGLSEDAARKLSDETGVSFRWLFGSVDKPPISRGTNEPYTPEYSQWYRAEYKNGRPVQQCAHPPSAWLPDLFGVAVAAAERAKSNLFMWRLAKFIDEAREEFGSSDKAKELAESVLFGRARIAGHLLRIRDLWIVDRHRRGVPYNLGSAAANLLAARGHQGVRIAARKPRLRPLGLTTQKPFAVAAPSGKRTRRRPKRRQSLAK